jgi:hypothetical protein
MRIIRNHGGAATSLTRGGVEIENAHMPENTRQYHAGELRLLSAVRDVIVAQMLEKIS